MAISRNGGPKPVSSLRNQFQFPPYHHLVVTTETKVLLMKRKDTKPLLESSTAGILAAREAKDGSGNIAIADEQTVLIHNTQKLPGKNYKLHATRVFRM